MAAPLAAMPTLFRALLAAESSQVAAGQIPNNILPGLLNNNSQLFGGFQFPLGLLNVQTMNQGLFSFFVLRLFLFDFN